ncbi:ADX protein, partial [Atrichornis clamosus]|nr:ADX protein [Atrichornis clamosus]
LLRAAAASSRRWLFSSTSPAAGPRLSCGSSAAAGRTARLFSLSARAVLSSEDKITVHFINRDGDKLTAKGKPGDSLLDVVVDNNLDIDGFGACEGTLACSTCHLIFENHIFEKLDAITDEEMDMLDLAYGLTETSRLGCQICLKKSMNDMTVRVPEAVADARQSVDMSEKS